MCSSRFAEKPCEIKTPLADTTTMETETIVLLLEISKPRNVVWLCKGEKVTAERFKISVDDTGLKHTLTIEDITLDENAEFTVQIDDQSYGVVTSNCQVTVKGEKWGELEQKIVLTAKLDELIFVIVILHCAWQIDLGIRIIKNQG